MSTESEKQLFCLWGCIDGERLKAGTIDRETDGFMVRARFFLAHVSDRRFARDDAARCLACGRCWTVDGYMVVD